MFALRTFSRSEIWSNPTPNHNPPSNPTGCVTFSRSEIWYGVSPSFSCSARLRWPFCAWYTLRAQGKAHGQRSVLGLGLGFRVRANGAETRRKAHGRVQEEEEAEAGGTTQGGKWVSEERTGLRLGECSREEASASGQGLGECSGRRSEWDEGGGGEGASGTRV